MDTGNRAISSIREVLTAHPKGMKIKEISQKTGINRNSVSKYLEILLTAGQVQMRQQGMAKIYHPAKRVSVSTMVGLSSDFALVLDKELNIVEINDPYLQFAGLARDSILGHSLDTADLPIMNQQSVKAMMKEVLSGGEIKTELSLYRNGEHLVFRVRITPTVFLDGRTGITVLIENITEVTRQEKALKESEENFRKVFHESPIGIVLYSLDGKIKEINKASLDLFGIPRPASLKNLDLLNFLGTPENAPSMLRTGRVMRFESAVNLDLLKEHSRSSFRSGTINLDVQIVPIRQGAHSLNDCLIQLQDVTARKQAEAGFDLYKILLENTLSSLDEAIFLLDLGMMTIDDANGTAEQIFGYSRDEMVGKPVRLLHAAQGTVDNQFSPDAMADVERGGYREFECEMKREDGEIFPAQVLIRPISRENSKPEKSVYVVRDLTDRREVEDALRRREHHYRTLAEAARDLVFVFNHDDKIMYINRYAARICGGASRGLIGRPRRDLFPDYVADLQGMRLHKVFESGRTVHIEEKLRMQDREFWVDTHMIPLKDPTGEVKEVLVVSRDIDEYKILQNQSRKTLDLLQTVVEGFPIGIELLDSKGMLIMANREFRKIFGVSDAKSTIRLNPLSDPNLPVDLRERLDRHRPIRYEITYDFSLVKERKLYRSSRIGLVSLEIRVVPLFNKNRGTLNGYLVLVRDITDSTTR